MVKQDDGADFLFYYYYFLISVFPWHFLYLEFLKHSQVGFEFLLKSDLITMLAHLLFRHSQVEH